MIKVGDIVLISSQGIPTNYSGRAKVTASKLQGWYGVKILEDHEPSGFRQGNATEFHEARVHELPPLTSHDVDVLVEELHGTPDVKATNPKDAIGSDKLPLHLWPETATVMGTLGMLDGALKYGRTNWRAAGVRASIYIDALKRHANAWLEGEDYDPDSGVPHLAHALACLAILVDAQAAGQLTDDRQFPAGYRALVEELTPHVKRLKEKHADKSPKHWTIADA